MITFEGINRKYTERIACYIEKGYVINTGTMSGSESEIAKVDLTDGNDIYRVAILPLNEGFIDGIEIIDGKCTDQCKPNSERGYELIWNNHIQAKDIEKYYKIAGSDDEYGTIEEAKKAEDEYYKKTGRLI